MSYDQWKTASPYDDEPDYIEICSKLANKCKDSADNFESLRITEFVDLLNEASDTLYEVANYIEAQ
jgi:hypothetical protein